MHFHSLLPLSLLAAAAAAAAATTTINSTATLDLTTLRGTPQQHASGILYGIPANRSQIPRSFYTEVGINHGRGGGSQVPGKGWIGSRAEYDARIESAHSDYLQMRSLNGRFFLLVSALWGADGLQTASDEFPCDNGDCSNFDAFLVQLAADIKRLDMKEGLIIELWNEADYNLGFWTGRELTQFLETWGWAYHRLRGLLTDTDIPLSGPAFATELSDAGPWPEWFQYAKTNQSIPDMYTWHVLFQAGGVGNDLQWGRAQLPGLLEKYGLPERPVSINEYAPPEDQNPAYSAWAIAMFERFDTWGLRANWAMGGALHDYMASLVGKSDNTNSGGEYSNSSAGYWPTGEWQLYKYYKQEQTGLRVSSDRSPDGYFDAFATWDKKKGRLAVVAGTNDRNGTYGLSIKGLGKTAKKAKVVVKEYPWIGFRAKVEEKDIRVVAQKTYAVKSGQLTIPVEVTNSTSGYSLDIYPS